MSDLREKVARAIDPQAYRQFESFRDYCLHQGDDEEEAVRSAQWAHQAGVDRALAQADAAISICMEEAAPLVEQAFRDGLSYAQHVKVDDPDLAWETSRSRAAIRSLKGGGDG